LAFHSVPPLLRESALLLTQLVTRVGSLPREEALELESAVAHLRLHEASEVVAGRLDEALDLPGASEASQEANETQFGSRGGGEPAGGEQDRVAIRKPVADDESERPRGGEGAHGEHDRDRDQGARLCPAERNGCKRAGDEQKADAEGDLECKSDPPILRPQSPRVGFETRRRFSGEPLERRLGHAAREHV
jgi:hypothetical protein